MKPTQHPKLVYYIYKDKRAKAYRNGMIVLFYPQTSAAAPGGAVISFAKGDWT